MIEPLGNPRGLEPYQEDKRFILTVIYAVKKMKFIKPLKEYFTTHERAMEFAKLSIQYDTLNERMIKSIEIIDNKYYHVELLRGRGYDDW